jgi:hypothetical protein
VTADGVQPKSQFNLKKDGQKMTVRLETLGYPAKAHTQVSVRQPAQAQLGRCDIAKAADAEIVRPEVVAKHLHAAWPRACRRHRYVAN